MDGEDVQYFNLFALNKFLAEIINLVIQIVKLKGLYIKVFINL